tara:strand:+ start:2806 stop:3495 length:690 start_codon:yes stop_codon:yes gene_type:complete
MPEAGYIQMHPDAVRTIFENKSATQEQLSELTHFTSSTCGRWRRWLIGQAPITLRNMKVIPPDVFTEIHQVIQYDVGMPSDPDFGIQALAFKEVAEAKLAWPNMIKDVTPWNEPDQASQAVEEQLNGTLPAPGSTEKPLKEIVKEIVPTLPDKASIDILMPGYGWLKENRNRVNIFLKDFAELISVMDSMSQNDAPEILQMARQTENAKSLARILDAVFDLRSKMSGEF